MHGEVISFYVTPDSLFVVMTVSDPDEGGNITVKVPKNHLAVMAEAEPRYEPGPPHTATPRGPATC